MAAVSNSEDITLAGHKILTNALLRIQKYIFYLISLDFNLQSSLP